MNFITERYPAAREIFLAEISHRHFIKKENIFFSHQKIFINVKKQESDTSGALTFVLWFVMRFKMTSRDIQTDDLISVINDKFSSMLILRKKGQVVKFSHNN